jgi:hypothetical protein
MESSPSPLCTSDRILNDLLEAISSPVYPSDLNKSTTNTQTDVPTINSDFDNLSTYLKPTLLVGNTKQQMNLHNVSDTDFLNLSPIESPSLFNDLLNIDKDVPTLQIPSIQDSSIIPPEISTTPSIFINSSIENHSNTSVAPDFSNSISNNVTTTTNSNIPQVRFISKQTELADDFTQSLTDITSECILFIFSLSNLYIFT